MAERDDSELLGAFMLGWRVALAANDIHAPRGEFGRVVPLLQEIAGGRLTLVENPEERLRTFRSILAGRKGIGAELAEVLRETSSTEIAEDRELAKRILRVLGVFDT